VKRSGIHDRHRVYCRIQQEEPEEIPCVFCREPIEAEPVRTRRGYAHPDCFHCSGQEVADPRHTCVFCGMTVSEEELVRTKAGFAHETPCAEDHYPTDSGDSRWPK
jgi:hypothetical protein